MEETLDRAILSYLGELTSNADKKIFINSSTIASQLGIDDSARVKQSCEKLAEKGYFKVSPFGENNVLIEEINSRGINDEIHGTNNQTEDSGCYKAADIPFVVKGMDVPPCFDVSVLVEAFVKVLDSVCSSNADNVPVFGIFAPWGRGKTYFFNEVKGFLKQRYDGSDDSIQYDVVEFNAWKYQDTPAFWAYLYQTILNTRGKLLRLLHALCQRKGTISLQIGIIIVLFIFTRGANSNLIQATPWLSAIYALWDTLHRVLQPAMGIARSNSNAVSTNKILGTQANVESSIEALLSLCIKGKHISRKKILLYVDDIDRCDHEKMVDVIESLRTILENKKIKDRLVVVCSIDPCKLASSLALKYRNIVDLDLIPSTIKDQFDKIFLSSISLPELASVDVVEYISKLSGEKLMPPVSPNSDFNSDFSAADFGETKETVNASREIDNQRLSQILADVISSKCKPMTPRQISVLYYRCIMAVMLKANDKVVLDEDMVQRIVMDSYPDKVINNPYIGLSSDKAIKIVVPHYDVINVR